MKFNFFEPIEVIFSTKKLNSKNFSPPRRLKLAEKRPTRFAQLFSRKKKTAHLHFLNLRSCLRKIKNSLAVLSQHKFTHFLSIDIIHESNSFFVEKKPNISRALNEHRSRWNSTSRFFQAGLFARELLRDRVCWHRKMRANWLQMR